MNEKSAFNRRQWLKMGLAGAAGTVLAAGCETQSSQSSTVGGEMDTVCDVSPRQELGPFPPMKALSQPDHDVDLTLVNGQSVSAEGEVILVKGKVLDTACNPVEGAIVLIWQANHHGKYHHEMDLSDRPEDPHFQGWGQAITNAQGEYQFKTIVPGLYTGRTRHIHFKISRKGYHEMVTQMYFEGEEQNATDSLLNQLTHEEQQRLICGFDRSGEFPAATFNINLEKVQTGSVPETVLQEYAGSYQMTLPEDHPFMKFMREVGVKDENIVFEVSHEGRQLFLQGTSAPKAEVFWISKDKFNAMAYYSANLVFLRNEQGKVSTIRFESEMNGILEALKII
ncbi:MAG: protocatechuate 3,4-dioxygenase [Bacteroidia bacterium]|nr:protocatechuate 3,4-dioxygenase [Bacteroidia bacterium]